MSIKSRWIIIKRHVPVQHSPKVHAMLPVLGAKATEAAESITGHIYPNEVWVRYQGVDLKLLEGEYETVSYTDFIDYMNISHELMWWGHETYYEVKQAWVELFT